MQRCCEHVQRQSENLQKWKEKGEHVDEDEKTIRDIEISLSSDTNTDYDQNTFVSVQFDQRPENMLNLFPIFFQTFDHFQRSNGSGCMIEDDLFRFRLSMKEVNVHDNENNEDSWCQ